MTLIQPAERSALRVVNPATGELNTTVPVFEPEQVAAATMRAEQLFTSGIWSRRPPRERAAVLLRLAELMERDAELLARLDCEDGGKPITECRSGDVPGAIEAIRWFAEAADKLFGRIAPTGPDSSGSSRARPSAPNLIRSRLAVAASLSVASASG